MSQRQYTSATRYAAAQEKRERVIEAALQLLRECTSIAEVSLEAVARAAGVTRLTVYNQFGSRRGLLEAVFDRLAQNAGMHAIADAMAEPDPFVALTQMVRLAMGVWSQNEPIARLFAEAQIDPEFAEMMAKRVQKRRHALTGLVSRLVDRYGPPSVPESDVVDMLDLLISYPGYDALRRSERSVERIIELVTTASRAFLDEAFQLRADRKTTSRQRSRA
ncbi:MULTISPECIES: TetR/AcrR family transcriptional regulator [Paraburkholderia]|uniref:TetR/AcrR family transcriptional regulator n=1 Tax=Paraburkholderia TaxID=1822464 RepID=UPI00285FD92A|nr:MULTISPECIES: TetR/AcrR family transcriptional regulator [Paraburkholderia]MDR6383465.1 AcrR family transcriptional regulator [Paraburkholderia caribensis]MDR6388924.1 AcrR family transcriptional regulator [Paraburkholderia phenoliruptrix]MDR6419235.1 AcrR family transcriptional regulator [Paraburkholderia phenoliruptrix]